MRCNKRFRGIQWLLELIGSQIGVKKRGAWFSQLKVLFFGKLFLFFFFFSFFSSLKKMRLVMKTKTKNTSFSSLTGSLSLEINRDSAEARGMKESGPSSTWKPVRLVVCAEPDDNLFDFDDFLRSAALICKHQGYSGSKKSRVIDKEKKKEEGREITSSLFG